MKSHKNFPCRGVLTTMLACLLVSAAMAQNAPVPPASPSADGPIQDLQEQVRELRSLVEEMRAENAQSRTEMQKLREDLQATRALLERPADSNLNQVASQPASTPHSTAQQSSVAQSSLEDRVQKLEDSTSLINSKVDEQYQTKVETASKYRARLHGIVLMNAFRNVGGSNNFDLPDYAESLPSFFPQATFGATLRQSEIGLEVFGPTLMGAKTSADVQMDFAGGFTAGGNGVNFGLARLQTASLRFDWAHTSVVAGQDALFISPLSPTSFASLAEPAFGLAGNLWGWTPQLRIEHRFDMPGQQNVTIQAGIIDNLDWEYPYNSFYRNPNAGELSGQPAYAVRTAWSHPVHDRPLSLGVAGYYGRQNWTWSRYVDAWAAMADWQVPLTPRLALSGEFYRGRGVGGLGGGIATSILYGGDPANPFSPIRGLDSEGGWAQLKLQVTPKIELNGAFGQDNPFASDVRGFATDQNNFGPILGRNRGALANVIFRPRSDLILAAELRRLRTFPVYSGSSMTSQLNLSIGILF
ncbi:MAG TPA: hypothetical protein VGS27_09765 [Candidatus Sulfotelmatobacter sp.]|nr:hypothetical protein [Candidatus Sulfotelmatobacter sp.]